MTHVVLSSNYALRLRNGNSAYGHLMPPK
uniref:Uncharacterized protein n=1 Tax=Rhizophora mucronata TaxID=61149 RepID=A0A2P2QDZ9_RHIMU